MSKLRSIAELRAFYGTVETETTARRLDVMYDDIVASQFLGPEVGRCEGSSVFAGAVNMTIPFITHH